MARHKKDAYFAPPDVELQEPANGTTYKVIGTPPPTPVFYQGRLIGWKVAGEEAIYPVRTYRNRTLFSKT